MCIVLRCFCALLSLSLATPILAKASARGTNTTFASSPDDTERTPVLSGSVADPSGARIPHAAIRLQTPLESKLPSSDLTRDITSDATGHFYLNLAPGTYNITFSAPGFDPYTTSVTLSTSSINLNIRLSIATHAEVVTVPADDSSSTSASDNKSAIVFKASDLKTFSDDDTTFQQQIQALAGSGDGGTGPQLYVDGFSGGRFPPKNSIREIRINQNPYSAQFDSIGFGRIEIFTKPGTDAFHGFFSTIGNDSAFNSGNPFVGSQPPYHSFTITGNASGPLNRKTSLFLSAEDISLQNNAVVNATTGLDPAGNPIRFSQAIASPTTTSTYSARLDRQINPYNTFIARYEFNQVQQTNGGVGLLVLASEGVNSTTTNQTLQLSNTQVIGANTISETHFQYVRNRFHQDSVSSAPTLNVEGAFNGGGSPSQFSHDNQDHYEFQEIFTRQQGKHFIRIGGRYRLTRDANLSTANYNGAFTFSSLRDYTQTLANIQNNAPITVNGGGASQFTLITGQPSAVVQTGDLGLFAEDEWKLTSNFTLNYGLRFETQSAIPDHFDPAPRVGFAWAIRRPKKPAIVTFRVGTGFFYDRFTSTDILTSIRQNGVSQVAYTVTNPTFFCTTLNSTTCPTSSSLTATPPTLYKISPNLRSEYTVITGIAAERNLFHRGTISVTYQHNRGIHLWDSANINAPLPGTYAPGMPTSGVRPLGTTQNIYQFQSGGVSTENRLFTNINLTLFQRLSLFGYYSTRFKNADTSGADAFPSNSYHLAADYGRTSAPHQRLYIGVYSQLPFGFQFDTFLSANSSTPFNITTGSDLNGDTQYNDRPSFATASSPAASVIHTRFGAFNTTPVAGETIIPINYGNSPAFASLDFGLGRSFKFGPRPAAPASPAGAAASKKPAPLPPPRFTLTFGFDAQNIFNHVNAGTPVGVLSSPLFGQSISLNNPFGGTASNANRVIQLTTNFQF
jgi:hypothetical protein